LRASRSGFGRLALLALLLSSASASPGQQDLDAGVRLFLKNELEQALPRMEQAAARDTENAEALAWLAETRRRLGNMDEALNLAGKSLRLQPRNSFAHLVIAEALWPYGVKDASYDTVWFHVDQAVACDSTDGNAWQMMWPRPIYEGNVPLFRKVIRKMVETEFLTKAALAYGRWELRTLPAGAVLFTNGDMDTWPAEAVQVTEQLRPDVAVVERGLLATPTGRRFVSEKLGAPMPYTDAELDSLEEAGGRSDPPRKAADLVLGGWIEGHAAGAFTRPIAFAPTVESSWYRDYQDHLVNAGAFLLWQPAPVSAAVDTAAIRASLAGIRPGEFRGPWVGERDRSPVRRVYTKYLARNVTVAAITCAEEMAGAGRTSDARDVLRWAERFERETELGPTFTKEIEALRARLHRR
jgi:hypothetical protein